MDASALLPLEPKYMIATTPETERLFAETMDEYGDAYATDTTPAALRDVFQQVALRAAVAAGSEVDANSTDIAPMTIDRALMEETEGRYVAGNRWGLFRRLTVWLDVCAVVDDPSTEDEVSPLTVTRAKLLFYGAEVSPTLSVDVTYVVVTESDLERLPAIQEALAR